MLPIIRGNDRPNAPQDWVRTARPGVQMMWHHVIPFAVLRDTWNTLVTTCRNTQSAESRLALRQYMLLCATYLPGVEGYINRMRDGSMEIHEGNMVMTLAVWPPWGIVEGPARRGDDPGDNYIDRFTHGLTAAEYARVHPIEELYRQLVIFNSTADPFPTELRAVASAFSVARPVLACDRAIPFRDDMWERDNDGLWTKRRTGE